MSEKRNYIIMAKPELLDKIDFLACQCCLDTETELFPLTNSYSFLHKFCDYFSYDFKKINTTPYVCNICLYRIKKINVFLEQCRNATILLEEMYKQSQLTTDQIKQIDRTHLKLSLYQTNIDLHSYNPNKTEKISNIINYQEKSYNTRKKANKSSNFNIEEVLINEINVNNAEQEIKTEIIENNVDNYENNENKYENMEDNYDNSSIDETDLILLNVPENIPKTVEIESETKTETEINKKQSNKTPKTAKKRKYSIRTKKESRRKKKINNTEVEVKNEGEGIEIEDVNVKNAILFYNSHPTKQPSEAELQKRLGMLEKFSKTYNVDIKFLTTEEQKQELEDRKKYYKNLPYACKYCYRGYSIQEAYNTHMTIHDPVNGDFACEVCGIRSKTRRDREKHINATHLKRFTCRQCGVVTKSQSYAKSHFARHSGKNYACDQCGKKFTLESNHVGHIRTAHGVGSVHCSICGEQFIGRQGLCVHVGIMHKQADRCKNCNTLFHNKELLQKHLENTKDNKCDTNLKPCPMCAENFQTEKAMRSHYDDVHKKELLKCDQCNKVFVSKLRLSTHMHEHKKAEEMSVTGGFMCEVCGKGNFKNLNTLRAHQRLHTGERPFKCTECNHAFRAYNLLKNHMYVHTDERRYKCPLCPKAFHQSAHRTAHILLLFRLPAKEHYIWHQEGAQENEISCEQCGLKFAIRKSYLMHVLNTHGGRAGGPRCWLCDRPFFNQVGLMLHITRMHATNPRCSSCNLVFANTDVLAVHVNALGGCQAGHSSCPKCGRNFPTEGSMTSHYKLEHRKDHHKCEQCDKSFNNYSKYSKHMKFCRYLITHSGNETSNVIRKRRPKGHRFESRYCCEICGKETTSLASLVEHQRKHTDKKTFQCTQCPKSYKWKQNLVIHITTHTGERKYKCPICPKAFRQMQHRGAHMLTHTKERPFPCSLCPKRYTGLSALKDHVNTAHHGLPPRRWGKKKDQDGLQSHSQN